MNIFFITHLILFQLMVKLDDNLAQLFNLIYVIVKIDYILKHY